MNKERQVRLRAIEPEDLDMLYRIENDVELWNVGTTNVPYSRYALHDYVAHAVGDIFADKQVRLMVENGEGNAVGIVDLVDFDARNRKAEVGIVIENAYRRRGYATEALRQLSHYASEILHLHQLYVYVDVGNTASLNLFSKAGWQSSAELKDWLYDGKAFHPARLLQTFL